MRLLITLLSSLLCVSLLSACKAEKPPAEVDMVALRQAVMKKTQDLYRIHLKLDTAAADITAAELKARDAECSDAEYLAADAYRNLELADQELLQLGRDLQALFNLDVEKANRN